MLAHGNHQICYRVMFLSVSFNSSGLIKKVKLIYLVSANARSFINTACGIAVDVIV